MSCPTVNARYLYLLAIHAVLFYEMAFASASDNVAERITDFLEVAFIF